MRNRNTTNTDGKELLKLRTEIEKGLNSGISKRSMKDIIASKQHPKENNK